MKIHILGDSTASSKYFDKYPERGWGVEVGAFFTEEVEIVNHARNGRSTKLFIEQGRYQKVLDMMNLGDFAIIQFGHNDASTVDERHTPLDQYEINLTKMINGIRKQGGTPILFTPISRRYFTNNVLDENCHGQYPSVMEKVARDTNTPLIDMYGVSKQWLKSLGDEGSKKYFLHLPVGSMNYPDGVQDNTHLNIFGAYIMAEMIVNELKKTSIIDSIFYLPKGVRQ